MAYRDPAPVQCETCLNKKVKSPRAPRKPMSTFAAAMLLAAVSCLFLGIDIAVGVAMSNHHYTDGMVAAFCAPFSCFILAAATIAGFKIGGEFK